MTRPDGGLPLARGGAARGRAPRLRRRHRELRRRAPRSPAAPRARAGARAPARRPPRPSSPSSRTRCACSGRASRPRCSPPCRGSWSSSAAAGADAVVLQPFDLSYAATPAAAFVARDLVGGLGCSDAVVGYDFTAGHERARVDALRPLLAAHGVRLHVVEPVTIDGLVVSSTKVREFLLEGNVEAAALLLARPHDVDGIVSRGAGRGRGFGSRPPTCRRRPCSPRTGCTRSASGGRPAWARRAGGRGPARRCVQRGREAHRRGGRRARRRGAPVRLRRARPLRRASVRVAFLARLREERRFPSVDALRAQIAGDVARARTLLARGADVGPGRRFPVLNRGLT